VGVESEGSCEGILRVCIEEGIWRRESEEKDHGDELQIEEKEEG
jgi:hypothetical protein